MESPTEIYKKLAPKWRKEYLAGDSIYQIGHRHQVNAQTVYKHLRRLTVPIRSNCHRKYPLTPSVFDKPLTAEAAYWLGILYADGCLSALSNGHLQVTLTAHKKDRESLTGFLTFVGRPMAPIAWYKGRNAGHAGVVSKELSEKLQALGLHKRKTTTIRFPKFLSSAAESAFIRGYFDGDGSVYFRDRPRYKTKQGTISLTGNPGFIKAIQRKLQRVSGTSGIICRHKNKTSVSVRFEGLEAIRKIAQWLYTDKGPALSRKHKIFKNNRVI